MYQLLCKSLRINPANMLLLRKRKVNIIINLAPFPSPFLSLAIRYPSSVCFLYNDILLMAIEIFISINFYTEKLLMILDNY